MDLVTLRQHFAEKSGRYDLVVDAPNADWSDNGADFYIQAGQKYLEKFVQVPENTAQIYASLAADEYSLSFQKHCRSVETVFINTSEKRSELTQIALRDLKSVYYELPSEYSNDPMYYALANLRALETTAQNTLGTFINLTHDETDTKYDYRGLIIVPPATEAIVVEVTGTFMQNVLSLDADENWWTQEYPHVLIMGAMRALEVFNRNTQGTRGLE